MHHTLRSLLGASLLCAAVGCGDQQDAFIESSSYFDAPVALDGALVFVDAQRNRALLLDTAAKQPVAEVDRVDLPYGAEHAERRNGAADEALVLCKGRRSSPEADEEPAALVAIAKNGKARTYDLGTTPFDTLVQSDDGRYVVLLRKGEEDGRVLSNANQLAIVDLGAKPSEKRAVTHRTPTSFGHRATHAVFSPTIRIAEEDRRLLVVLSDAEVTIIDLGHPDRRETVVQLGGSTGRSIQPTQVLWSSTGEPTMYVRGDASNDVFAFRLEARDADEDQNDFRPSINQLGGGAGPTDMALYEETIGETVITRLLVVSPGSRQALVIDPSSSKATAVTLQLGASNVLLFHATSPKDDEPRTRALLYGEGVAGVSFLDLDDIETRKGRNVETLHLGMTVTRALPLLEKDKVVLMHEDGGVSVLDLPQRTAVPILSSASLADALFDAERNRMWVAPAGAIYVGTLDLFTGVTDEVLLDAPIKAMFPMLDSDRVAIVHESTVGYVTFLDAAAPSRETAHSVRGFFLSDILDRGEP
jgi:hypothetical protein